MFVNVGASIQRMPSQVKKVALKHHNSKDWQQIQAQTCLFR